MRQSDWDGVIEAAIGPARGYLDSLPERRVHQPVDDAEEIRSLVGGPLPEGGTDAAEVVASLARDLDPYITAHASGRFFGFVIGGLHPASYGADLLTTTWDQNGALFPVTPGTAIVEEVAADWLLDLLRLPEDASVGFVTGGQMANFTCLAAARDRVLRDAGWDVRADGLQGAPRITVIEKEDGHSTVGRSLRHLGLGDATSTKVACDDQSRVDVDALANALAGVEGPTIICVESANINMGSFDPFDAIADLADEHRHRGNPTWVHVDGAIGLWARASERFAEATTGAERLDSWSTDAHKLLNAGYDSGIAICRDAAAHMSAMSVRAPYLIQSEGETRDPMDWVPEFSRRARGTAVYAVLRSLGRSGVVQLVDRTHDLANVFAQRLAESGEAEILNDVVFNQVLVRWRDPGGEPGALTDRIMRRVQESGVAFFSGTTWRGERLMRISVSDWATDEDDVARSVEALLAAAAEG